MATTRILAAALAPLLIVACASTPDDPLETRNPSLAVRWASPDTRVPPFDRVMLAPIETQYREVEPLPGPVGTTLDRTEFPVKESDRLRISQAFDEIFREELGKDSHFELTDQPGPGVLLVKPALRDIVSRVPPDEIAGRSDTFLDTVGDATLVVDLVNSETGQTLGTVTDRRTAQPAGAMGGSFGAVRSDRVNTGQEVRRLARRWATSLDNRLETIYFEAKPR